MPLSFRLLFSLQLLSQTRVSGDQRNGVDIQGGPKKVIPLLQCNVMYERYHFLAHPVHVRHTDGTL